MISTSLIQESRDSRLGSSAFAAAGFDISTAGTRSARYQHYLEPIVEPVFHSDSYGYRPGKSAIEAVHTARERCCRYNWVLDLDIKGFFDSVDWELMLRAVRHHTDCPWALLYIERWRSVWDCHLRT